MILIVFAVGWLAGLLLAAGSMSPVPLAAATALASLAAIPFRRHFAAFWPALALGAAALGDWRFGLYRNALAQDEVARYVQRSTVRIQGVMAGDPTPFGTGVAFPVDARLLEESGEWKPTTGLVQVRAAGDVTYRVGDRLEFAGVLQAPDPLLPEFESTLRQDGIVAVTSRPTITALGDWERTPTSALGRLRDLAADALNRALPEPEAGLARGITLGQKGTLAPDLVDDFSRTNTSHILAVDGFKVGLAAGFFEGILQRALSPLLTALGTVGGIALYTAFVGATPSALRAAVMGGTYAVGRALGRPRDTLNGLALAAVLLTAVNPFLPWNLAFQLSFCTTAGLALFTPLTSGWLPHRLGILHEPLATTLAAEIGSAPLIVASFDQVSLASLPVHAVVMPLLPFAIGLSAAAASVGLLVPALGNVVGFLAWVPLAGIIATVQTAGAQPLAALAIPPLGLSGVVALYAAVGLAALSRPNPFFGPGLPFASWWGRLTGAVPARFVVPGLAVPIVLAGVFLLRPGQSASVVRFLAVPAGDAALVQLADGTNLYLAGIASGARTTQAIGPDLGLGNRQVDLAVVLDGQDEALSSLDDMAGRLALRQAVLPADGFSATVLSHWQSHATQLGIKTTLAPAAGSASVQLGQNARLTFYPLAALPKQGRAAGLNPSLAARLELGPASFLFASALPADQARLVAAGVPLAAQTLQLIGPANRWGLDPAFFGQVNPSLVILPASVADRFAQATQGTNDLLADRRVFRTDQDGTVTVTVQPSGLRVETSRGD
jgi:competence protein ComEC